MFKGKIQMKNLTQKPPSALAYKDAKGIDVKTQPKLVLN